MPRTARGDAVRRAMGIVGRVAAYLVMGTFALMTVAPLAWLVMNSLKPTPEYRLNKLSLPTQLAPGLVYLLMFRLSPPSRGSLWLFALGAGLVLASSFLITRGEPDGEQTA